MLFCARVERGVKKCQKKLGAYFYLSPDKSKKNLIEVVTIPVLAWLCPYFRCVVFVPGVYQDATKKLQKKRDGLTPKSLDTIFLHIAPNKMDK